MSAEKNFKHFLEKPNEVRMEVIGEMEPDDRCRLRRCSNLTNKEAKASKKFMYLLHFHYAFKTYIHVSFGHGSHVTTHGFKLQFIEKRRTKVMEYFDLNGVLRWTNELEQSTNLVEFALQYFKNSLQLYQNTVRKLEISGFAHENELKNFDFGIHGLNRLEELDLADHIDIRQFLTKLKKPLSTLSYGGERNMDFIANCPQIYQVTGRLNLTNLQLNYEQLLQLSAKKTHMSIGHLKLEDIFNFVNFRQYETEPGDLEVCTWNLEGSDFDENHFFKLFRERNDGDVIKHHKDDSKKATFFRSTSPRGLYFQILPPVCVENLPSWYMQYLENVRKYGALRQNLENQ